MAITEAYAVTETVTTTEHSLTTDTSGPDTDTSDGVFQLFADVSTLAKGDIFIIRLYEKAQSGGTQRVVESWTLANAQAKPIFVTPSFILMHGWDFTIVKSAGTDRSISASVRKVG